MKELCNRSTRPRWLMNDCSISPRARQLSFIWNCTTLLSLYESIIHTLSHRKGDETPIKNVNIYWDDKGADKRRESFVRSNALFVFNSRNGNKFYSSISKLQQSFERVLAVAWRHRSRWKLKQMIGLTHVVITSSRCFLLLLPLVTTASTLIKR